MDKFIEISDQNQPQTQLILREKREILPHAFVAEYDVSNINQAKLYNFLPIELIESAIASDSHMSNFFFYF